ncbi:MAG: sigma-70 family RNA polymerase sigma factor [Acidobacteriota bacterium]
MSGRLKIGHGVFYLHNHLRSLLGGTRTLKAERNSVESSSLEELLTRSRSKLSRILYRYRIPAQDAEDLLQETFLILVSQWESIRNPDAWLAITLRNRCVIYWRRHKIRLYDMVDDAILEFLSDGEAPEQEKAELRVDLDGLLERLPERCQRVLRLRYGLGCSAAEVGKRLGYQPSSVPKVTHRCLSQLADQLVGEGFALKRSTTRNS